MKMENTDTIKLIGNYRDRLLEVLEVTGKIDANDIEYCHELSINCLEAKPKALHSMKCDENICSTCNGTGEVTDVSHVTWPCVDCHTEEKI